jgi:hypothetical protein
MSLLNGVDVGQTYTEKGSKLICMPARWVFKGPSHAGLYQCQRGSRCTWQPSERFVVGIAIERHLIPVIATPSCSD